MTKTEIPEDIPNDAREVGRWDAWLDSSGKLWTALTGAREVWAYGSPVKVRLYPRAARIFNAVLVAILLWIAWHVASMANDIHLMMLKERP